MLTVASHADSRRRSTRMRAKCAGSLLEDLSVVASRLCDALHRCDITVWTDADGQIYFDAAERSPWVGSQWLAGTYGVGACAADIEADLLTLRRERVSAAILD